MFPLDLRLNPYFPKHLDHQTVDKEKPKTSSETESLLVGVERAARTRLVDLAPPNFRNYLKVADPTAILQQEIIQINSGMIAEQFVSQELIAYDNPTINPYLVFWETEKGGQAEIDFVISYKNHILPIKVKSGSTGSLRSLKSFMSQKKSPLGVRISEHNLSFHDGVLSVPFYLIKMLPKLIDEALSKDFT